MSLSALGVREAASAIAEGRISAVELVESCLARVREVDDRIGAWAFLDPGHALAQARAADEHRMHGRPLGPLHGVPVGVMDIFDTADYPTEFGSPLWKGRTPRRDAGAVARLRTAGAIIMGKTVTTEYAGYLPAKTRNPHDPDRTPGGASSGSAAAVAAGMVPAALGSQTPGSIIPSASFCGVVGFKPSHGLITRSGALMLSRTLDHVGVLARSVEDAALVADALAGFDEEDPDTRPVASPQLALTSMAEPPLTPRLAFVKGPPWQHAEPVLEAAFRELAQTLGDRLIPCELDPLLARALGVHRIIVAAEAAHHLRRDLAKYGKKLGKPVRDLVEEGRRQRAVDYLDARMAIDQINAQLWDLFDEFDAILTASAPGEAPRGLANTGNPAFSTAWTCLGTPAVSLPLLQGESGLTIGIQLIGRRGHDARLLRTARWLAGQVDAALAPTGKRRAGGRRAQRTRP